jgi:hypothetical protein
VRKTEHELSYGGHGEQSGIQLSLKDHSDFSSEEEIVTNQAKAQGRGRSSVESCFFARLANTSSLESS